MRLIDADALKKELDEQMNFEENCRDSVFDIIDNALTIEPNEIQAIMKDYLVYRCEWKRPQGKWVGNAFDEHHCSNCGHPALWEEEPDGYYEVQSRFCPNCGACMQEVMQSEKDSYVI